MKARNKLVLTVWITLMGTPLLAHHGTFTDYLAEKMLTMKGTVTEFQFVYPHVQIHFQVTGDDGAALFLLHHVLVGRLIQTQRASKCRQAIKGRILQKIRQHALREVIGFGCVSYQQCRHV